ncbi:MAG: hypothetical protein H0T58_11775 [Gemmatimonadales bacterium]|nr:hypothetical protein [Gemmatimonadales bacterium]
MLTSARAVALASALLGSALPGASAGASVPDTAVLEFLGFRAGARLDELAQHLHSTGSGRMRCRQSRVDPRVNECRAALKARQFGGAVELWVSAMDSVAGVITLSGIPAPGQLEHWREELESRYGRVSPRTQGAQKMFQWVRRGRMMRLTWRVERGQKVVSVSLVDGRVLDSWGRTGAPPRGSPPQPASRTR